MSTGKQLRDVLLQKRERARTERALQKVVEHGATTTRVFPSCPDPDYSIRSSRASPHKYSQAADRTTARKKSPVNSSPMARYKYRKSGSTHRTSPPTGGTFRKGLGYQSLGSNHA